MEWTTVKISTANKGRNTPFASIGFGRISLNAAACELIEDYEKYNYAELLKARDNFDCIGVRFLKESQPDTIKISRKVLNGKTISGVSIENKKTIEDLFGMNGIAKKVTRFNVQKDNDSNNILIIMLK